MKPIELPTLSHFLNGNGWLGSAGLLRFQIEKPAEETMAVVLWQGPFSRPYAQEVEREVFPVTEEGRQAALDYLGAQAARFQSQPPFSPAETAAFYRLKKQEEAPAEPPQEGR